MIGCFIIAGVSVILAISALLVLTKTDLCSDNLELILAALCMILCFVFVAALGIGISGHISAKLKLETYKLDYEMIQEVVSSGEQYDNVSISQTIIEYNSWLTKARASKETFGIFSSYYLHDIESLDYITR